MEEYLDSDRKMGWGGKSCGKGIDNGIGKFLLERRPTAQIIKAREERVSMKERSTGSGSDGLRFLKGGGREVGCTTQKYKKKKKTK